VVPPQGFHHAHSVDALYQAANFEWTSPRGIDLAVGEPWAGLALLFSRGPCGAMVVLVVRVREWAAARELLAAE
jgi:hypothetical protein